MLKITIKHLLVPFLLLIGVTSFAQSSITTVSSTYVSTPTTSVIEALKANTQYSTFMHYLTESGYLTALQNDQNYTVFAPTNQVIAALPENVRSQLDQDKTALKSFVGNHIYKGNFNLISLGQQLEAKQGKMRIKAINNDHSELYLANGKVVLLSPKGDKIELNNQISRQSDGVIYQLDNASLAPRQLF